MKFKDQIGKSFPFFGVDNNQFKLGGQVWEAVENECDGYRSMLEDLVLVEETNAIFQTYPITTVTVKSVYRENNFEGYEFVDFGGHVWLRVGTELWDSYYPYFVVQYTPNTGE